MLSWFPRAFIIYIVMQYMYHRHTLEKKIIVLKNKVLLKIVLSIRSTVGATTKGQQSINRGKALRTWLNFLWKSTFHSKGELSSMLLSHDCMLLRMVKISSIFQLVIFIKIVFSEIFIEEYAYYLYQSNRYISMWPKYHNHFR